MKMFNKNKIPNKTKEGSRIMTKKTKQENMTDSELVCFPGWPSLQWRGEKLKHGSDTLFLATKLKIATTSFRKLGWVSLCYKTWIWYVINCLTAARKRHKHLEKQQNKTKHTSAGDRTPRFGRQSCCIQGIVGKAGKNDFATFLR